MSLGFDINWFIHNDGIRQQKPHPSAVQSNAIGCDTVIYHSEEFEAQMTDVCYRALKEQGTSAWIMCIRPTFKHYSGFVKNPTFESEADVRKLLVENEIETDVQIKRSECTYRIR